MIKLYGLGGDSQIRDFSPFVLKILTYLKIVGLEHKVIQDPRKSKKAPKNKLPFIDDQGTIVCDSYFILKYLQNKYVDLDKHLNDEQRAQAHILMRCLDEDFYWYVVYSRWQNPEGWKNSKNIIFEEVPKFMRHIVAGMVRKGVLKQLYQQGIGRHSEEEITHLVKQTLSAISLQLENKPYYFGEELTSVDVVIYAFISQFVLSTVHKQLHELAHSYTPLVEHTHRIDALLNT